MDNISNAINSEQSFGRTEASYSDWISGINKSYLTSNVGSKELGFQNWRNFKEAFSPELIRMAVKETEGALGRPVKSCIDPFGGSGTTALACQFLGISPTTIEVNPYLADLIEAKLSSYNATTVISYYESLFKGRNRKFRECFPGAPQTFCEPGLNERYLFNLEVAQRLANFRHRIDAVPNPKYQKLFRALLGSAALEVCNAVVSGKGRRYRKNWQTFNFTAEDLDNAFASSFNRAIFDIQRYRDRPQKDFTILRGDSRKTPLVKDFYDLTVFSPPYPNSFDYTDVYNIELWTCGYLSSPESCRSLRNKTLRSHVQLARSFKSTYARTKTWKSVIGKLDSARGNLWNRHIPEMVDAYFDDMMGLLLKLQTSVVPGGRIYAVVGDSQYAGIRVPVAKILQETAKAIGLEVLEGRPYRSMRVSAQQGGKAELAESLLVFSVRP